MCDAICVFCVVMYAALAQLLAKFPTLAYNANFVLVRGFTACTKCVQLFGGNTFDSLSREAHVNTRAHTHARTHARKFALAHACNCAINHACICAHKHACPKDLPWHACEHAGIRIHASVLSTTHARTRCMH
eukprot:431796-Pleurochrysis_carterae.AAC.2